MRRIAVLIMFLATILLPLRASAQDRAIHWDRWDIVVDVRENGDLQFTETQRLVIDRGSFRFGARSFATGQFGRVSNVRVSENGQAYRAGNEQPGTFTAVDDGKQFSLSYFFLDPNATTHEITLEYTVAGALVENGDQARLQWRFFCEAGCPRIDNGSATIQLPGGSAGDIQASTAGVEARQTQSGATTRWELTGPIQNSLLNVTVNFPRALLAANARFRSAAEPAAPQREPVGESAPRPIAPTPNLAPSFNFSPIFCFVIIIFLFIVFSSISRSARRRTYGGPGPMQGPMHGPMPGPMFGGPFFGGGRRRWGRRRRGYNDWDGGWGSPIPPIPPVIITPPIQPPMDYGQPFNPPPQQDAAPGGAWNDSTGGGGSWGDSTGGGGFWGGDASGGGGSWGGGDSGGGDGGGGGGSSSFG